MSILFLTLEVNMKKNIIILGGGYSGVLTAKKLAKKFKNQPELKITLIDKHPFHTMLTELHEVAAGRVAEDSVKISLKRIFAGRNVEIKLDTIKEINCKSKTLVGENETYNYDVLVLASGSQPAFFNIDGADDFSYKLWSYEDAIKLREHILAMFRLAIAETDTEKKSKLLTFYVVGAGFTGIEMVGELAEWVQVLCDEFEISRELVKIVDVDLLEKVVPNFPDKLCKKTEIRLEKMGIKIHLKTNVMKVNADSIVLKQGDKTVVVPTSTVIWTAGIESSEVIKKATDLKQAARSRIQTDEYLRAIQNNDANSDVFVVGDNMFYIPQGDKSPVPQMVENCELSASTAAKNIAVAITGNGEMEKYEPKFHGMMLSIGGRYGLAYVGTDKTKFMLPSFLAMFVKHFINIIYFIQVLGWNKVFSYMHHEFFTIRDCRSFVGGHFSNRTPSFLLVPLRVFLGAFWIYEAAQKITQGWLTSPKIATYIKSANDLFNQILNSAGKDVTSSATQVNNAVATTNMGTNLLNLNVLNLFKVIVINSSDIAFKIQIGLMDWFNNTFILSHDNTQIFFQCVIVFSELAIGALLIVGLFTTISSGYSLILQALFVTTTGIYLSTWWMIFAAIALLIGGGKIFGLDYYVMPYLKKRWKKVKIARKLYIYND
jgi:NADH dehydrogenase